MRCRFTLILISVILSGSFAMVLATEKAVDHRTDACTAVIAVGNVLDHEHTLVGQTWDARPYPQVFGLRMTTNKETGIKVIWDARFRKVPRLSSAGVFHTQNYRSCGNCWDGDPDNSETLYGPPGDAILGQAHSAKEAAEIAEEIAREHGVRSGAGGAKVYGDADEVYMIEGNGPEMYDVLGPWTDAAIAHSNAYLSPEMKRLNEHWSAGVRRMIRAQELLDARSSVNMEMGFAGGLISPQYVMELFRDHIDGFNWVHGYEHDGHTRSIAGWGSKGRTVFAIMGELPPDHRDMLSIAWTTPNYPPFCPYLPFFIGMPEIPPSFAVGEENQTDAFVGLVNVMRYNLDYADEVEQFWQAFDDETTRQLSFVIPEAKALINDGKKKEAGQHLYEYVNSRCEKAVLYARQLAEAINKKGLIPIDYSPFRDLLEPPRDVK